MTTVMLKIAWMQFFAWWRKHLAGALPYLFPDPDQEAHPGVSVAARGGELVLPEGLGVAEKVVIELEPSSVLFNARSYPFNVIGSVAELLRAEIDELTPFASEDVLISHRLDRPDWSGRQYSVTFAVIRKEILGGLFQKAESAGLRPLGANAASGGERYFFPAGGAGKGTGKRPFGGVIRGLVALLLLFAVAFIPSMKLGQITSQRGEQLQAAREEAQRSAPVLERVQWITESLKRLEEHRAPTKSTLYVLSELSKIIPRDSWLDSFELDSGRLRIVGFSPTPAEVVTALSQSAMLTNIQYRAVGTRDRDRNAERFELTAQIVDPGAAP